MTLLTLSGIPLNKKSVSYLSYALGHQNGPLITSASLKRLNLEHCQIKSSSLSSLSLGVKLSRLEKLNLNGNVKVGSNVVALVELVQSNTSTLRHLDLRGCDLGQNCVQFVHALVSQNTLEYVNLRGNTIDSSLLAIIASLMVNYITNYSLYNRFRAQVYNA